MTYQVFVGNIGTVYSGDDRDKAHATYRAYVNLSDKAYGRGAREVVSLMENGNTIEEFNPPVPLNHGHDIGIDSGVCEVYGTDDDGDYRECGARRRDIDLVQGAAARFKENEPPRGENCIEDMRCPGCGNHSRFKIVGTAVFEVTADGTEDYGDVDWDDASHASCPDCHAEGTVGYFKQ
jgi:hypothetical protein